jgi:hypothetical protein
VGHTWTCGLKVVRSSESAPILILGGSWTMSFKLFNVLKKNWFTGPCPIQSVHRSCSIEKEKSERETNCAFPGAARGIVTGTWAKQTLHPNVSRSSVECHRIVMVAHMGTKKEGVCAFEACPNNFPGGPLHVRSVRVDK